MDHIAWVLIPGNTAGSRIGIVKLNESGYYRTDYDRYCTTKEEAQATVDEMNRKLGIPKEVAESALAGSMFGWDRPVAYLAVDWFEGQAEASEEYWSGKRLESHNKQEKS